MKKTVLILYLTLCLFIFSSCGISQSCFGSSAIKKNSEKIYNEILQHQIQRLKEKSERAIHYTDDYVSFTYDPKILAVNRTNDILIIYDATTELTSSYPENTITIFNMNLTLSDLEYLKKYALQSVDILFDSCFSIDNELISSFCNANDGYYEYQCINNSNTLCRGKIFSINSGNVFLATSEISNDLSSELYISLNDCFDSIKYLGKDPWLFSDNDVDELSEIEKRAEEAASKATIVESGSIYDSIAEITDSFQLIYIPDDTYSIELFFKQNTNESISTEFISLCEEIYSKSIPANYGVVFSLTVNNDHIATFTISSEGYSSEPIVFNNEYEPYIINEYDNNTLFSEIDMINQYEKKLNSLSN